MYVCMYVCMYVYYIYIYIYVYICICVYSLIGPKVGRLRPNAIAHCGANVCAHGLCG